VTRPISKLLAIPAIGRQVAAGAVIFAVYTACPGSLAVASAQESAATADREAALKAFNQRVDGYLELKKKMHIDLAKPKPGDRATTGKAEATEDTLAARIQIARKDTKPGDVFGDAATYFKQIIQHDAETRGVRDAFAAMEEVPAKSPPAVNATYPEKAALATVPPLILVNLPRLPDGLEYRFMGRHLILRDRDANLIVDFVPGAVPVLKQ
jgi:hypothetical protein